MIKLLRDLNMRASWDSVLDKIVTQHHSDQLSLLFQLLLTEDERNAISGRLKIFQLLLTGGLSQRQIAAEYQISIATITRCSNYLKQMSSEQREAIRALII